MKYFKISISETIRDKGAEDVRLINQFNEVVETIEDVKEYLINRYGHLPGGRNKTYRDTKHGKADVVGFIHSFWVKESRNSYYSTTYRQTDWVEITEVTENVVLIHAKKKEKKNRAKLYDIDSVNLKNIMYYYKITDSNHNRQRLVTEMLEEVEHLINRHLNERR